MELETTGPTSRAKRKRLATALLGLGFVGLLLVTIVFMQTLRPTARAFANLPHIDISGLEKNHYLIADLGVSKAFVLHLGDDSFRVFLVPFRKGQYLMPDISWVRAYMPCTNFAPDAEGGRLQTNGRFRCHAKQLPMAPREWIWDFNGKNLGEYTEDMIAPKFRVRAGFVVLGAE